MQRRIFKLFGLGVALAVIALAAGHSGQIGLAQGGKTITVCASGCDFAKIQAAIDSASAGDTIQVQDGTYAENVTISSKQDLTLQGAGRDVVTLDGSAGVADQKPAILIQDSQKITIKGFKIAKSRRAVHAIGSTGLVVADNRFENNLRQSVLFDKSEGQLTGDLIQNTQLDQDGTRGEGVNIADSQVILKDNTISKNILFGIVAQGSSQVTVINNRITETKSDPQQNFFGVGINLLGSTQVTIQGNTIAQNDRRGILIQENVQATIQQQNTIADNNKVGIMLGGSAKATIEDNTIIRNAEAGIELTDSAEATITNNQINNNKFDAQNQFALGVWLLKNSRATIEKNTISQNAARGIRLDDTAQAMIRQNMILANNRVGVSLFGSAKATIEGNTITDSAIQGITVGAPDIPNETIQVEISKNTIRRNGCGVFADNDPGIKITGQGNDVGVLCGDTSKFPTGFGGGK